jgi:parallel beta-helix repeat protein
VGKAKPGWSEAGIKVAESFNITLENNTCIMNKDGIAFREQGPRNIVSNDGQTTIPFHLHDNRVIRNLLAGNRDYQLGIWYDNSFFGWHPNEKKKYKTEPAWRASLKERNMADYDPRKQKHVINSNYYIFSKDQPPFLFGCPWRPRSEKYSNPKDYVTSTGFDSSSAFTAAPMPADPARIHPGARKKAKAMKAGWLNAPSNIAVWTRSFALRDPT